MHTQQLLGSSSYKYIFFNTLTVLVEVAQEVVAQEVREEAQEVVRVLPLLPLLPLPRDCPVTCYRMF